MPARASPVSALRERTVQSFVSPATLSRTTTSCPLSMAASMTEALAAALPNARTVVVGGSHLIDPAGPEILAFVEQVLENGTGERAACQCGPPPGDEQDRPGRGAAVAGAGRHGRRVRGPLRRRARRRRPDRAGGDRRPAAAGRRGAAGEV